ncbi:MAG: hypothetical protein JXB47_20690 [Anaerolineae bacterium]|nr:hypothetical protein [Anaerolineae bacterium]
MRKQQKQKMLRWVYTGFAIMMVVLMACAGLTPLLGGDTSEATPSFPTPAPGTPASDVELGLPFTHPSGAFEITPPRDWAQHDASAEAIYGSAWISNELLAVVHTFTTRVAQPDDWLNFVQSEYPAGFSEYEDYTVAGVDYESDPITIDFLARLEGLDYLAREWAGVDEDVVWVLRIVTPANYPALLDYLGETILPTFKVHPDALPGD